MLFCVPGVAAGEYDIRSIDLQIAFLARGHIAFLARGHIAFLARGHIAFLARGHIAFLARGHIDLQLQFSLSILCTSGYN